MRITPAENVDHNDAYILNRLHSSKVIASKCYQYKQYILIVCDVLNTQISKHKASVLLRSAV